MVDQSQTLPIDRRSVLKKIGASTVIGSTSAVGSVSGSDTGTDDCTQGCFDDGGGGGGSPTVQVGTDATFDGGEYGDAGTSRSGAGTADITRESGYSVSNDDMTAVVILSGGYGTSTAYSVLGTPFDVSGSSGQSATVSFDADIYGEMNQTGGSNFAELKFRLEDITDNETYSQQSWYRSDHIGSISTSVSDSMLVDLQPDHSYEMEVELTAYCSSSAEVDLIASDFSDADGDGGHYAHLSSFQINW